MNNRTPPSITLAGLVLIAGCSTDAVDFPGTNTNGTAGSSTGGAGASGGVGGAGASGGAGAWGGTGGSGALGGAGGDGATGAGGAGAGGGCDAPVCGLQEKCSPDGLGIDDDCNGLVDEGCACVPGTAHWCFAGDPSALSSPTCVPGEALCLPNGTWGPCVGGSHEIDGCATPQPGCHPITGRPFSPTDLATGLGSFWQGALTESWSVGCPAGDTPCPSLAGATFQAMVSGEHTVKYTKTTAGNPSPQSCSFPLHVRASGIRIELEWEHDLGGTGVDLDLHLHQPGNTQAWSGVQGTATQCSWNNCTANSLQPPTAETPDWFNGLAPPEPVDWYLDPVLGDNTCYFAPRGLGAQWQQLGLGCHNPRLDADNIQCDVSQLDFSSADFCVPENTNVDYPPAGEWFRVGVYYYANHGVAYAVHPRVRVYCDGRLAADLGPNGYSTPVTFTPAGGSGGNGTNSFWLVGDVRYEPGCPLSTCRVAPLYADGTTAPRVIPISQAQAGFGPPYPP